MIPILTLFAIFAVGWIAYDTRRILKEATEEKDGPQQKQ